MTKFKDPVMLTITVINIIKKEIPNLNVTQVGSLAHEIIAEIEKCELE